MKQCCDNWDEMDADDRAVAMSFTAPAIAAFLCALPSNYEMSWWDRVEGVRKNASCEALHLLAAAVLAAAKEGA